VLGGENGSCQAREREREREGERGTEGETNRLETWSHKNKIAKGKRRLKEGRRARTTLARGDSIPAPHLPGRHLPRCRVFVSGLVIFKTWLGVFVYWLCLTLSACEKLEREREGD
jgi:hypothetical protein